jgi:hypothetical protein
LRLLRATLDVKLDQLERSRERTFGPNRGGR